MSFPAMPKIEWDQQYSVGVGKFDEQHKKLFDYLNDLRESMLGRKGKEVVAAVLDGLLDYTNGHFLDEEVAMFRTDYPDYWEHKAQHDKFLSEIRGFYVRFHAGHEDSRLISAEIVAVVTEQLQEHILIVDKAYSLHMKARGVK